LNRLQARLTTSSHLLKNALFGPLFLATCFVAQAVVADVDSRYADYIVPGFEQWDEQREQWNRERIDFLSQSEIAWIRVSAKLTALRGLFGEERRLTRESFSKKRELLDRLFIEAGSDLYSLVAMADICQSPDYMDLCFEHGTHQKIISRDSENGMAYMIAITANWREYYGHGNKITEKVDTPAVRQFIIDAAKTTIWTNYYDDLLLQYYRETMKFVRENPPPTEAQRQVPDHILAFMQAYRVPVEPVGRMELLGALCRHYDEIGQKNLISACAKLAALLRENHWSDGYQMEASQANRDDPFGPEGVYLSRKSQIFGKVRTCLETQWLHKKSKWPRLSRDTIENYVIDVTEYGRWEATRNASVAEYKIHPSEYDVDPGTCEAMLDLNSDEMAVLLGDEDPQKYMLENRDRIRLTQEYAAHVANDARMMIEIEKLDTVESVSDPLVQHLGSHGEPAVPYLLEKLCSSGRMTALAAAYALSSEPTDSTLYLLLEVLAESRNTGRSCEAVTAITSVMSEQEDQLREIGHLSFGTDFDQLMRAVFCEAEEASTPDLAESEPPTLIVFSGNVSEVHAVGCEYRPLEARPKLDKFGFREWVETNAYHGLRVKILDLPQSDIPTPAFEKYFGARPVALANVFKSRRGGGEGQLWVKTENGWIKLQNTHSIME